MSGGKFYTDGYIQYVHIVSGTRGVQSNFCVLIVALVVKRI